MSSFARDLTSGLSKSLSQLSPSLVLSPPPSAFPSTSNLAAQADSDPKYSSSSDSEEVKLRLSALQSTLAKVDPAVTNKRQLSTESLALLAERAFPPFQGLQDRPLNAQVESVELLLVAQLSIATYGLVVGQLIEEAGQLGQEDDYWAGIENDGWSTGVYLVQTGPSRALSLAFTSVSRLRAITTSSLRSSTPSQSLLSISTFRSALPSSVLLASIFPHLATAPRSRAASSSASGLGPDLSPQSVYRQTRKLLFLKLSPLVLARQEVAKKRADIKSAREVLAMKIGTLTLSKTSGPGLRNVLSSSSGTSTLEELRTGTWDTLRLLDRVLSTGSPTMVNTTPSRPADLAHSLQHLLKRILKSHTTANATILSTLERPSPVIRAWPYLLSIPLSFYLVGRTVYTSRETLRRYANTAGDTARGFIIDWVVEPIKKILETVRHGDDGAMALMGKESLRSDLESLERMVIDFGRDQYGLGEEQLKGLAEKVRAGDLTSVLRVWEKDIKSPIRSAVSGSLIRTLLIQVQKVKVDVALAMDGIEKMLRSQQLTFGFVGVAPSLLVLYAFVQWFGGLFRRDGGKKTARDIRRRCWGTMRHLDALLAPRPSSESKLTASPAQTQGFLLLESTALRTYAESRYFPTTDTQILDAFLEDIRALEDSGTESDEDVRRVLVGRLWRWSDALGWNRIV
ncbi:nuclear control of ATPase protein 2, partial [Phenoliferia sp. Uapishka_3]